MKLYIGGIGQGQEQLARQENPQAEIIPDFHTLVRSWIDNGMDVQQQTEWLCNEHPQAVVVSDEVGCGVVPMGRENRFWREQAGRAQCLIAARAEQVTRVLCGIGVRIK